MDCGPARYILVVNGAVSTEDDLGNSSIFCDYDMYSAGAVLGSCALDRGNKTAGHF